MSITLTSDTRGLVIKTPYNRGFVDSLKRAVSNPSERRFDRDNRAWIVDPRHVDTVRRLVFETWGIVVPAPAINKTVERITGGIFRVEYLGQCKERAPGIITALGNDGRDWSIEIPENVLRAFFRDGVAHDVSKSQSTPQTLPTLYAALLVNPDATAEEIKSGYRRMARLVHPDINHEPDAHEQMQAVTRAYDVLADPMKRKRYDAGLALEATLSNPQQVDDGLDWVMSTVGFGGFYRAPLRCGLLTVDGIWKLGRVAVSKIHQWEDIVDALTGSTLVTSWPLGAKTYESRWV